MQRFCRVAPYQDTEYTVDKMDVDDIEEACRDWWEARDRDGRSPIDVTLDSDDGYTHVFVTCEAGNA